ncbi:MAG: T9SS type A sorting domain-containing protein, partial [Candidatus Sabulitectum sp.]|nr:T9SS type A sorting domain-containing protein [Candidatus Sabulitectum sp.]
PVIQYDGTVLNHAFSTKYPVFESSSDDQYWYGGPRGDSIFRPYLNAVSRDQCYFWMTGVDISISESGTGTTISSAAYVYSVNSQTGSQKSWLLASYTTPSDQIDYEMPVSYTYICKIYKSGAALVEYGDPFEECQYIVLAPPGDGTADVLEETSSTAGGNVSVSLECERSFSMLSNPVTESLDVMISGESGDSWNLSVFDISGRCVLLEAGVCPEGGSVLSYGTGSFPSGIYMLRVEAGGVEEVQSFSIVH